MPQVSCPNGHRIQVTDRHIGQTVKCPSCQATFIAAALGGGSPFDFGHEDEGEDRGHRSRGARSVETFEEPQPEAPVRGRAKGQGGAGGLSLVWLMNNFAGKPLLFFGLLFVVLGRGCDATSMRSVTRTDAYYRQAKVAFQLEWEGKTAPAQQKIDKVNRQISETYEGMQDQDTQKRRNELMKEKTEADKELNRLRRDMNTAQVDNENGAWKPLREAALKGQNNHRMAIYWYEWLFIFGTVVLVLGLLIVAFTGEGAERWIAYIMIAIITFSIYVGGAAWIESIMSSSTTAPPIETPRPPFPKGF